VTEPVLDAKTIRRNRLSLILIAAMPLSMMLIAYLIYKTGVGLPEGTANRGELILPPRQIDDIQLQRLDGQSVKYADLDTKWTFFVVGDGECTGDCRERLYFIRQLRVALAKEAHRIRRFYLTTDKNLSPDLATYIAEEQEGLEVFRVDETALERLMADSTALTGSPSSAEGDSNYPFFIIDARGFVMMYYTPEHTGKDIITDMKFLLKYNQEKQ